MDQSDDHNHDHNFDGFSLDEIKKNFKTLGQELEQGGKPIAHVLDEIEENEEETQLKPPPFFRGYIPTIDDYLQRARTHDECEEIISYCLQHGEITSEQAEHYRYRLKRGGPRAFGTRGPGYYDQKL